MAAADGEFGMDAVAPGAGVLCALAGGEALGVPPFDCSTGAWAHASPTVSASSHTRSKGNFFWARIVGPFLADYVCLEGASPAYRLLSVLTTHLGSWDTTRIPRRSGKVPVAHDRLLRACEFKRALPERSSAPVDADVTDSLMGDSNARAKNPESNRAASAVPSKTGEDQRLGLCR